MDDSKINLDDLAEDFGDVELVEFNSSEERLDKSRSVFNEHASVVGD